MSAAAVEIWIRERGSRRQAFFRQAGEEFTWRPMQVKHADKALREGSITLGETESPVVSRETQDEPEHPAAAGFRATAASLNLQIDAINRAGRAQ